MERHAGILEQTDTRLFPTPLSGSKSILGRFFQPSQHQRRFHLLIHSSLFILSLKGTPHICPLPLLPVQDRSKSVQPCSSFSSLYFQYLMCLFIVAVPLIPPVWMQGLWHHLMQSHPSPSVLLNSLNPKNIPVPALAFILVSLLWACSVLILGRCFWKLSPKSLQHQRSLIPNEAACSMQHVER